MVRIRLSRAGTRNRPFYHLVVADKRSPRDGRYIERIGFYDPIPRGAAPGLHIDQERLSYWQGQGAQLSERVAYLTKQQARQSQAA